MLGQGSLPAGTCPRKREAQLVPDPSRRWGGRLRLRWPQLRAERGRGPPTFNMKLVEAVYVVLRAQDWVVSTRLDSAEMPLGWAPGSLLVGCSA